jgi:diguanylate cyclase (GGDEF)-like protein
MSRITLVPVNQASLRRTRWRGGLAISVLAMLLMVALASFEHRLGAEMAIAAAQAAAASQAGAGQQTTDMLYQREAGIARYRMGADAALAGMCAVLLMQGVLVVWPMYRKLIQAQTAMLRASRMDVATSCLTREAFGAEAVREFSRARRFGIYFALVLLDLDGLKAINSKYGHAGGDAAVSVMATMLHMQARGTDVLGRLDGDTFAILMPHTSSHQAKIGAERIQHAIAQNAVILGPMDFAVTVSVGITMLQNADENIFAVYARAENALSKAKETGVGGLFVED